MMSNLMRRKLGDGNLSDPTDGICESFVDGRRLPGVEEPIPVRVRVRWYGESVPEVRQARAEKPDFGQLPVGSILDCYV